MRHIKAIGFDLFNTLITAESHAFDEAVSRLINSLGQGGLALDPETFREAHRQAAMGFIEKARQDGRETHNRYWISAALETQGHNIPPHDPRIAEAVDEYFSAFIAYCHPIPGTRQMLGALQGRYPLGLLSNFTHPPAARTILKRTGLNSFFDVVLISGDLGFRKPHPSVFRRLIEQLGVEKEQILFVGDDPEPDIEGAMRAGLNPLWMTYVRDRNIPIMPGFLSQSPEKPDEQAPRISTWKELLSLLDVE